LALHRTRWLLFAGGLLAAAAAPTRFEDGAVRVELPASWSIEGGAGEYRLQSEGEDVASLLLLLSEFHGSLHERLAEIEQQFVETGIIEPVAAESRRRDGVDVLYRRYRLMMGGPEGERADIVMLHQYSFERSGVPVLLQVETAPARTSQEELFEAVFRSLAILKVPGPFLFEDEPGTTPRD
jgi:hypothetical protein